ncbi:hypothetical protein AB1K32_15260 [Metabacillus dongyingensis]|uniref:hypothetical protein n=1 Tax=Metabacillus dongyingensis TaxID=2874282 RepID=UPI003B8E2316
MAVFKMPVELYHELKRYGVTDEKIAEVNGMSRAGITWWKRRHGIKGKISKLSDDDITLIRQLDFTGMKHKEIAERFNISRNYVQDIVSGRRKKEIS